jgi:pyrimidine-nucleoside phosphorylase
MDARSILRTKRDGGELSPDQIRAFLEGYVSGAIPDYVASALVTAIFVHGMGEEELACLTEGMLRSGRVFDFAGLGRPTADKHSTGGVGDKVSIPLAPAVAACGVAVPMISGRGLGHTGGTLDKLESIPGFSTALEPDDFERVLADTGVALAGQTADLVPADAKLYALRDATGMIESIPLIASSILSKKLAEGISSLVLDVKFGSGAFLPDPERGRALAETMIALAGRLGLRACAFQTAMDRPLGRTAGNSLEIAESIECLRGAGPADLRELVCTLGGAMLAMSGVVPDEAAGRFRIGACLDDGSALQVFAKVVEQQGGDPLVVEDFTRLPAASDVAMVAAPGSGRLAYGDVRKLGLAVVELGGGRRQLGDDVDPGVGLVFLREAGAEVAAGDELVLVHHASGRGLEAARALVEEALDLDTGEAPQPLVRARLGADAASA